MSNLLDTLVSDEAKNKKSLYSAGKYWDYKNKKVIKQLKQKSLKDFRGLNSGVGTSYSDNLILDIRNELNTKGKIVSSLFLMPFINRIFNQQLELTKTAIQGLIKNQSIVFEKDQNIADLINKYNFNQTTEFGCVQKFRFKGKEISTHYLQMANRINNLENIFDFKKIESFFEIGGGFGSNVHFLLENFSNIKKIIYLDLVPNIYVGTEYLRYFFGNSVIDYLKTKNLNEIKFEDNNKLEIICIPPWEIEKLNIQIDHFHNADSFVEMPIEVVNNYKKYIFKNKVKEISLISYENFDLNTTFDPNRLVEIFDNKLSFKKFSGAIKDQDRNSFYYYGKNF